MTSEPQTPAYIKKELRRHVGPTMRINSEESDQLERAASGKYRRAIFEVPTPSAWGRR